MEGTCFSHRKEARPLCPRQAPFQKRLPGVRPLSLCNCSLGCVGLACVEGAKIRGASEILAIDKDEKKFELAKKFGATKCINPTSYEDRPIQDVVIEMTGGEVVPGHGNRKKFCLRALSGEQRPIRARCPKQSHTTSYSTGSLRLAQDLCRRGCVGYV